jgi:hypothetical protein
MIAVQQSQELARAFPKEVAQLLNHFLSQSFLEDPFPVISTAMDSLILGVDPKGPAGQRLLLTLAALKPAFSTVEIADSDTHWNRRGNQPDVFELLDRLEREISSDRSAEPAQERFRSTQSTRMLVIGCSADLLAFHVSLDSRLDMEAACALAEFSECLLYANAANYSIEAPDMGNSEVALSQLVVCHAAHGRSVAMLEALNTIRNGDELVNLTVSTSKEHSYHSDTMHIIRTYMSEKQRRPESAIVAGTLATKSSKKLLQRLRQRRRV